MLCKYSSETQKEISMDNTKGTAIISVSFDLDSDIDPCAIADCLVRELLDLGFAATLEDVETPTTTGEN